MINADFFSIPVLWIELQIHSSYNRNPIGNLTMNSPMNGVYRKCALEKKENMAKYGYFTNHNSRYLFFKWPTVISFLWVLTRLTSRTKWITYATEFTSFKILFSKPLRFESMYKKGNVGRFLRSPLLRSNMMFMCVWEVWHSNMKKNHLRIKKLALPVSRLYSKVRIAKITVLSRSWQVQKQGLVKTKMIRR